MRDATHRCPATRALPVPGTTCTDTAGLDGLDASWARAVVAGIRHPEADGPQPAATR